MATAEGADYHDLWEDEKNKIVLALKAATAPELHAKLQCAAHCGLSGKPQVLSEHGCLVAN